VLFLVLKCPQIFLPWIGSGNSLHSKFGRFVGGRNATWWKEWASSSSESKFIVTPFHVDSHWYKVSWHVISATSWGTQSPLTKAIH
jgi:hypothetical protein